MQHLTIYADTHYSDVQLGDSLDTPAGPLVVDEVRHRMVDGKPVTEVYGRYEDTDRRRREVLRLVPGDTVRRLPAADVATEAWRQVVRAVRRAIDDWDAAGDGDSPWTVEGWEVFVTVPGQPHRWRLNLTWPQADVPDDVPAPADEG